MINCIYLGCAIPNWESFNGRIPENTIIIDKNPHYNSANDPNLISSSIYDHDKIMGSLQQYQISSEVCVVPVADYAISAALNIQKYFNTEYFDTNFMNNKILSLNRMHKYGLDTLQVVQSPIANNSPLIKNKIVGNDSGHISRIEKYEMLSLAESDVFYTKYQSGILINFDLFFHNDGSITIEQIYRRFNDHRFRTVLTISHYNHLGVKNAFLRYLKNIGDMMKNFRGPLTFDAIYHSGNLYFLEISPFHHKPWLKRISANSSLIEYTKYADLGSTVNDKNVDLYKICETENKSDSNNRVATIIFRRKKV